MTTILKRRPFAARTWIAAVGGITAVAFALAGCGGSSGGHSSAYGASAPASASASGGASAGSESGRATVALANSKLGRILVDSKGDTLYLWQADHGPASTCGGACASAWPPLLTTGKPIAGAGLSASKLGTTKRSGGATEVTYNGHPLYTFAGDTSPGQTTGEGSLGFGAEWDVLSAAGNKVEVGN
jgi:predicted lipoprotein with Yx(FWY)xxD motif